jgi:hypothetical protein
VQCTGAFFIADQEGGLGVVAIYVPFAFAEVLLHLSLELFLATLDVLAGVVSGITQIATKLAFHLFGGPFDFVLEAAIVNVSH